jgi:hypothetical protein
MPLDIIAFDADDTLWENEPHYTDALEKLCILLAPFADAEYVRRALLKLISTIFNIKDMVLKPTLSPCWRLPVKLPIAN